MLRIPHWLTTRSNQSDRTSAHNWSGSRLVLIPLKTVEITKKIALTLAIKWRLDTSSTIVWSKQTTRITFA